MAKINAGSNATLSLSAGDVVSVSSGGGLLRVEVPTGTVAYEGDGVEQTFGPYPSTKSVTITSLMGGIDYTVSTPPGQQAAFVPSNVAITGGSIGGQAISNGMLVDRAGTRLGSMLDFGKNATLVLCGDSTGNETTEWYYLLAQLLAARYPNARVEHSLWNDTTQAYDASTVIQAGALTPTTAFQDNFSGTSAELVGRAPDVQGDVWGMDGSNALGDWSVSGNKMIRSADATGGLMLFGGGIGGDQAVTLTSLSFSTVGNGSSTVTLRVYLQYKDASNHLFLQISIAAAGTVSWALFKRIGGASTQIQTIASPAGIPGSTATVTGNLIFSISGTTLSASFGGSTISASITGADQTALSGAVLSGLNAPPATTIAGVKQDVFPTVASIQTLKFYNASLAGSTLAYQLPRLATMLLPAPDVLLISSSHNYGSMTGADYYNTVQAFVASALGAAPAADVILCSQNPRKSPATGVSTHAERCSYLRRLARDGRYGYMKTYEKFVNTASWQSLVNADGIHPTQGSSGTGSSLWRDAAQDFLDALRFVN